MANFLTELKIWWIKIAYVYVTWTLNCEIILIVNKFVFDQ